MQVLQTWAWNKFAFQGIQRCPDRMTGAPKLTNDLGHEERVPAEASLTAPPQGINSLCAKNLTSP